MACPWERSPDLDLVGVRLRHGAADWKAFAAAASSIGHGQIFVSGGNVYDIRTAASSAERGIHLEFVALLLFGGLAALVTLLLVSQAIARRVMAETDDYATLRRLGATSNQLAAIVMLWASAIGVVGAGLAFAAAALASPLMPIGLARQAEIHPGFDVDVVVLAPGVLAIVLLIAAFAILPARRASRCLAADGGGDKVEAGRRGLPNLWPEARCRW